MGLLHCWWTKRSPKRLFNGNSHGGVLFLCVLRLESLALPWAHHWRISTSTAVRACRLIWCKPSAITSVLTHMSELTSHAGKCSIVFGRMPTLPRQATKPQPPHASHL